MIGGQATPRCVWSPSTPTGGTCPAAALTMRSRAARLPNRWTRQHRSRLTRPPPLRGRLRGLRNLTKPNEARQRSTTPGPCRSWKLMDSIVILSPQDDQVCELLHCVVNSVADVAVHDVRIGEETRGLGVSRCGRPACAIRCSPRASAVQCGDACCRSPARGCAVWRPRRGGRADRRRRRAGARGQRGRWPGLGGREGAPPRPEGRLAVDPRSGHACLAGEGVDGDGQPAGVMRRSAATARRRVACARRRRAASSRPSRDRVRMPGSPRSSAWISRIWAVSSASVLQCRCWIQRSRAGIPKREDQFCRTVRDAKFR